MKKISKLISAVCVVALVICVPLIPSSLNSNAASVTATADSVIRVHLKTLDGKSSIPMNAVGNHTIDDNGKAISGAFTVKNMAGNIQIITDKETYDLDSDVLISSNALSVSNLITINNSYRYAGDLRLIANGNNVKIVNHIDYETYLLGVLPFEMSDSWPMEALKAQAVAARTYAYYAANSNGSRASRQHDVVDTTASQVYRGYNGSYSNCIAAINATSKQVLETNSGGTVYACYSASNGGYTEYGDLSGASWARLDYLPYKKDDADLKFIMANSSYAAKVIIPKTLPIASLRTSTAEPYKMLREKLVAKGHNPSNISGNVTVKNIQLTYPRYSDHGYTGANFTLTVPNVGDVVLNFTPYNEPGYTTNWPFLSNILMTSNKTMFSMLHLSSDSTTYTLASVRYGHGSGMSQVGAYQMAKDGKTYRDILSFYYEEGNKTKLVTKNWDIADKISTPETTDMNRTGKVNDGPLNVRSGAGTNFGIIGSLNTGNAVTITASDGSWYTIKYGSGVGYVSAQYITLDAESTAPPVTNPPETTPPPTTPTETTPPVTNPPETTPPVVTPPETKPPTDSNPPANTNQGSNANQGTSPPSANVPTTPPVNTAPPTNNTPPANSTPPTTGTENSVQNSPSVSTDNTTVSSSASSSSSKATSSSSTKSTSSKSTSAGKQTTVSSGKNPKTTVINGALIVANSYDSLEKESNIKTENKVYTIADAPGSWRIVKIIYCFCKQGVQEIEQHVG